MANSRRLTSYNVLSSHLASPGYFVFCKPEYLDPDYRFNGLLSKLDHEIDSQSIVCLQEVSHQWAGRLHTYFASKRYHFITGLYGGKFNGYMGVGVAVPIDKYTLTDVNIKRIADTKVRPKKALNAFWVSWALNILGFFKNILGIKAAPSYWDYAYNRMNQMICVGIKCKQTQEEFYVGNYHMPCAFRTPQVMTIHCSLAAQYLQNIAKGKPYAFLGDFNIKPDSNMYRLLTEGKIEDTCEEMPVNEEGDSWSCNVSAMRSAYKEMCGKEPDFTNYSRIKDQEPFIDTLDYIFLSKEWKVNAVEELPHRDEVSGPFPMKTEYSDHVLVAAEVQL